jgi:chromosomal replication initiator protein
MHTFARWVSTPENRSARLAAERVAEGVCSGRPRLEVNPLFLHGPAGTGKTHLAMALAHDVGRRRPDVVINVLSGNDFGANPEAGDGDLVIVEDVQHLPARAAQTLVQFLDDRLAHRQQTVFTATVGPALLRELPARLTTRLAAGLVVGLEPMAPASRLAFLQDRAERRQLAVSRDVLAWLADHLPGSGRQLEGAIARLEMLVRVSDRLPDVATVAGQFGVEAEATKPTVERIAARVGDYFRVDPRRLQSRRRFHNALLPRQVGMYLARQLTPLSLQQIGAYFGGRDHSTVLHACRKVERALDRDAGLSGAVRQLRADLG